jgi:hypothetical protein
MISQVSECGCNDIDCKVGSDCLGNRLEILTIGGQERIKLIAPHHKTDGAASQETNAPITFIFPLCILNTLLVWWIKTGWYLVREGKHQPSSMVFASGHVKTLSCYTMVGWWEGFKRNHCPATLKPGTITELRSIFIEAYTSRVPDDESKWHKAALVMGNSVSTWKKYYARHLKKRRLQDGIDSFESDFLTAGEDESESELMELPCSSSSHARLKTTSFTMKDHGLLIPMEWSVMSEIEGDTLGSW